MNIESGEPAVYYVEIRFRRKRLILKWYSDDIDHVAQKCGRVINYSAVEGTMQARFSADAVLKKISSVRPDFNGIINVINILEDVGYTKHRISEKLYEKIFLGCNLPSIRRGGGFYRPTLSLVERSKLEKYIVTNCELLFKSAIQPCD